MADVHEVHVERRRAPLWPAVVMLIVFVLLIGIVIAMIMNIRGSISWPAGSVEFAFRPTLSVTRTEPAATILPPTRVAIDVAPADSAAEPEPVQPAPAGALLVDPNTGVPAEIAPRPVE